MSSPSLFLTVWHDRWSLFLIHLLRTYLVTCDSEWATNQHRDSIASHIGHSDLLSYFAVAENNAIGRVRYQLLEVGPPSTW